MQHDVSEHMRLRALAEFGLVDTAPEAACEELVRLAADLCDAPVALITLLTAERQWIHAGVGAGGIRHTPREIAFCDHTIRDLVPLEVRDAREDDRFRDNPLVVGEPHVRYYYGHPLVDASGHALGALCVIDRQPRSLDDRQRAMIAQLAGIAMSLFEGRRRSLEGARLAASVDQDDDEIYIVREPDLRVQFMNARARAAARLKGLQIPRHWGFELHEVTRWTDTDAALLAMERLRDEGGRHAELETADEFDHAVRRPVALRMSRYRWGGDRSIVIRVRDLSERQAFEAALDEGRERWRFVVEACGVGVLDWDFESGTGHASAEARRLAAMPADAAGMISRAMWERCIHPDDLADVLDLVDAHLCGRTPDYDVEYRMLRHDRREVRVRERGRVLRRGLDGVPLRMVAVQHGLDRGGPGAAGHPEPARDPEPPPGEPSTLRPAPTARAFPSGQDGPDALRRQLDLLTTSLAHDVRAPLRALQDFLTDTAQRATPPAAQPEDFPQRLAVARDAGARIERIVLGLIGYARGGRGVARIERVDARAVFAEAWEALPGHARVRMRLGRLPVLRTDAMLLRTVADNLLSNALKYTRDAARASVEVDAEELPEADGWRIRVRDNGVGFPPAQAHHLFEPFQRLHPQHGFEGTGLGLASVRAIVERLGGSCGASNNADGGATFWFVLPRTQRPGAGLSDSAALRRPGRALRADAPVPGGGAAQVRRMA